MFRRLGSWLALYALLLQAFWPVAAAAAMASSPGGFPLQICTQQGLVEFSGGAVVLDGKSAPRGVPRVHHCLFCCLGSHASGILNLGLAVPHPVRVVAAPLLAHPLLALSGFSFSAPRPRGPPFPVSA